MTGVVKALQPREWPRFRDPPSRPRSGLLRGPADGLTTVPGGPRVSIRLVVGRVGPKHGASALALAHTEPASRAILQAVHRKIAVQAGPSPTVRRDSGGN